MQSSEPVPGNPWPHDMVIAVDDFPDTLMRLLWIREAWGLEWAEADVPPLLSDSPAPVEAPRHPAWESWHEEWPNIWQACLAHNGSPPRPDHLERLRQSENGSEERLALLNALAGPSWADWFGTDAFTDSYEDWRRGVDRLALEQRRLLRSRSPERSSLDALVPAWRAGLSVIVVIPCQGSYSRKIAPSGLLVTASARADPGLYSAALRAFG
ncbi:MAG: hypothetical protein JWN80_2037 [Microbacteriaceae bacterium]|nr:hypothetical protein [Microbacteriaceae bacterium]